VLFFDSSGGGLKTAKRSHFDTFAIAGADKTGLWAKARISADTVVISSPEVPSLVVVRYARAMNPS